jgi:hypothetical protein
MLIHQLSIHNLHMELHQGVAGITFIHPQKWHESGHSIDSWWRMMMVDAIPNRKALASLTLLSL